VNTTDLPASLSSDPESFSHTAFDRCLVDGDPGLASNRRRSRQRALGLSFVIEAALLSLLVLAPLMTGGAALPKLRGDILMLPVGIRGHIRDRGRPKPAVSNRPRPFTPVQFSFERGVQPAHPALPTVDSSPEIDIAGAGPISDNAGLPIGEWARPQNPAMPPPQPIIKKTESKPVKLSEGVSEAQLISRVEPHYPPLAVETRTQGTVRLHAIISRQGRITSLEVLSGHPFLVQAALEAVRQWRYRPTMLDGDPVEVETTITVVFQLYN